MLTAIYYTLLQFTFYHVDLLTYYMFHFGEKTTNPHTEKHIRPNYILLTANNKWMSS